MSEAQVARSEGSPDVGPRPDRWTWLGRHLEWLRPGLRAATEADAHRLRQSPPVVARVLPWAAVVVPLVFSIGTATTPQWIQATPYDQFAVLIYDVFTESTPFMLAGLAIGLASPAAGVLFVLSYAIGNLAATIITGELEPPLFAAIGRLASFALLWLLVVEIPLFARLAVESFGARSGAGMNRRIVAVVGGALVVTGLTWIWVLFAPISIQTVYWLSSPPGAPFLRPVWTLLYFPQVVIIPAGFIGALILGARYLGSAAPAAADLAEEAGGGPIRRWLPYASAMVLTGLLLLGVLEKPLDAVILFAAIVGVPPLARLALRRSGVAPLLVRVPGPVRLIVGALVSYPLSLGFLSIVGPSDVSRWFNTLFALAVSFFIIELLLEADDLIPAAAPESAAAPDDAAPSPTVPTVPPVVAGLFALLTLISLALPVAALAHGGNGETDGDAALGAGAAVGGAALGAAASRRNDTKPIPKPKPPPPTPPNPWDKPPKGPPLDPYGKKKTPPPDPPSDFDFWKPSTWFK